MEIEGIIHEIEVENRLMQRDILTIVEKGEGGRNAVLYETLTISSLSKYVEYALSLSSILRDIWHWDFCTRVPFALPRHFRGAVVCSTPLVFWEYNANEDAGSRQVLGRDDE